MGLCLGWGVSVGRGVSVHVEGVSVQEGRSLFRRVSVQGVSVGRPHPKSEKWASKRKWKPVEIYVFSRYASYWNALLLSFQFCYGCPFTGKVDFIEEAYRVTCLLYSWHPRVIPGSAILIQRYENKAHQGPSTSENVQWQKRVKITVCVTRFTTVSTGMMHLVQKLRLMQEYITGHHQ